jgi:hypothetical protein
MERLPSTKQSGRDTERSLAVRMKKKINTQESGLLVGIESSLYLRRVNYRAGRLVLAQNFGADLLT